MDISQIIMASKDLKTTAMKHEVEVDDNADQPAFDITPPVAWYKDAGLLKLYAMTIIPFLSATTNGYDGSLLNGLQTMEPWQNYFDNPSGSTLGLFSAILQVGSFSAIFFSSYLADLLGRRAGITVGMVVLLVGVVLQVVPTVDTGMYIGGRFLVGMGLVTTVITYCTTTTDCPLLDRTSHKAQHRCSSSNLPIQLIEARLQQCTTRFGVLVQSSLLGLSLEQHLIPRVLLGEFQQLFRLSCR